VEKFELGEFDLKLFRLLEKIEGKLKICNRSKCSAGNEAALFAGKSNK